jgi:hypothetical protein
MVAEIHGNGSICNALNGPFVKGWKPVWELSPIFFRRRYFFTQTVDSKLDFASENLFPLHPKGSSALNPSNHVSKNSLRS